ncbi:hypothetical protein LYNGBM3L_26160 [Moorena producens 3L]|uniref:Uncharacterized protein n=1 Tax=Moorena producens 3L TaxID=489825 RepID=F4XNY9_9CYAN|nr:hypothetical protein LYNGBM3L_26160 [Moorena producens 3L]
MSFTTIEGRHGILDVGCWMLDFFPGLGPGDLTQCVLIARPVDSVVD